MMLTATQKRVLRALASGSDRYLRHLGRGVYVVRRPGAPEALSPRIRSNTVRRLADGGHIEWRREPGDVHGRYRIKAPK